MIKAILLDYDGVMTEASAANKPPLIKIAKLLQMNPADIQPVFSKLWPLLLAGLTDENAFWETLASKLDVMIPNSTHGIWSTWHDLRPLPEMLDFITLLRSHGYPVIALSNVLASTAKDVRRCGGYDVFDDCVLSCEVGYAKPDPKIFHIAASRTGVNDYAKLLFVDDSQRNTDAAQMLGMNTIKATSSIHIIESCKQLLKL